MHALCLLSLFETFGLFKLALNSQSCSLSLLSAELRVYTTSLAHFSFLTNLMVFVCVGVNVSESPDVWNWHYTSKPHLMKTHSGSRFTVKKTKIPLDLPSPLVLSSWFIIHKIKEPFIFVQSFRSQGQWSVIPSAYPSKS